MHDFFYLRYTGFCLSFVKPGGVRRVVLSGVYSLAKVDGRFKKQEGGLKLTTSPIKTWKKIGISLDLFKVKGKVKDSELGNLEKELKRSLGLQIQKDRVSVKIPQLLERFTSQPQQQRLMDFGDVIYHFLTLNWKNRQ